MKIFLNFEFCFQLRMHQCCDQIRTQLNIPRYDIKDDTTYTHGESEPTHHPMTDLHLPTETSLEPSLQGRTHLEVNGMNGALDTSLKSRASKASSGHLDSRESSHVESHDTYNFKSTGSEDMFSTIRTDVNNATLGDTQALREYQQTITQQENVVVREDSESEGEVHYQEPVQEAKSVPKPVHRVQEPIHQEAVVPKPVKAVIHGEPPEPKPVQRMTQQNKEEPFQGMSQQKENVGDRQVDRHRAPTPVSQAQSELDDDYNEDYDSYDDDGDDEEGDGHQNTEPTATYRTDDDDF